MQQVSPTPDRTPLCSERGEKPKWDWVAKRPKVYPGEGWRPSTEEEKEAQVPEAPKNFWEEDIEGRRWTGRKVEKPATPFTFCKKARTFPGSKDEMYAMLPGFPAQWNAKWRMQRADIREDLDKVRHDVYQERQIAPDERPTACRTGEYWKPAPQVKLN